MDEQEYLGGGDKRLCGLAQATPAQPVLYLRVLKGCQ